jgi:hypothetical protein
MFQAARAQQGSVSGTATEHATTGDATERALHSKDSRPKHAYAVYAYGDTAPAATDITARSTSAATEHATRQKRHLKKYDDSHQTDSFDVTLSQSAAKAMAGDFFKFIQQESLLGLRT